MASVIAENLVETTSDGKFTGKPLEHIKSLIGEGISTGTTPPIDAPIGAVPTKTANGMEWKAPGRGIDSIKPVSTALALVTYTDGTTDTIPLSAQVAWSKDAQAKAQGYWVEVSETEPANTTYRTADGTVVPVIWEKPVRKLIPVIPQKPVWDNATTTVHVPELVGVEYRVGGKVIPPNTLYKLTNSLPFTARVEAVAKPGYELPNEFWWEHRFPDPTRRVLLASDNFSTTGSLLRQVDMGAGGTLRDAAPRWGATLKTEEYWQSTGGTLMNAVSAPDNVWYGFFLPEEVRDVRVEFDVISLGTSTAQAGAAAAFGFRATSVNNSNVPMNTSSTYTLEFSATGGRPRITGQIGITLADETMAATPVPQLGHWVLESIGDTLTVIAPNGRTFYGVSKNSISTQAGQMEGVFFRAYKGSVGFTVDNLRIYTYQY